MTTIELILALNLSAVTIIFIILASSYLKYKIMSKQTAVDFIVDKIFKHSKIPFNKENCPTLFKFIDQAKEMEKQQKIDAYVKGANNQIYGVDLSGLEYYEQTFKD